MRSVNDKRWILGFIAVTLVVIAQVVWWTTVFMGDVTDIAALKWQNASLTSRLGEPVSPTIDEDIRHESMHRRIMFLSESISFVLLSCFGLYLLLSSIRSERRSRDVMRNFMETFSHDSKTPLTALKLRLESLLEKTEHEHSLQLALDEVRRLCSIHERALNLNRLERSVLQYEWVDITEMVQEALRRLDPILKLRKVKVTSQVQAEVSVKGDLFSLQSSLQCLLENAILYNNKTNKEVSVSLKMDSDRVTLDVADNGPGIRDEDRPNIFDRFYRGASHPNVPGTGLGLFLVKRIIEAHHGRVDLIPDGIGGIGSRFSIELPLMARA